MKTFTPLLHFVLLCTLFMFSCQKEDTDPIDASIIRKMLAGDWQYQSITTETPITWNNGYYGMDGLQGRWDCQQDDYLSFKEDYSVIEFTDGDFQCDPASSGISVTPYEVIHATFKIEKTEYDIIQLDSSIIKFRSKDAVAVTYTLIRKKPKTIDLTDVGKTGTVTCTYLGNQTTYTTVKAKDGHVWLQQNMGSTQVASAIDDTSAYGHYFQWGRWDDGHQLASSQILTPPLADLTPIVLGGGKNGFYKEWWITGNMDSRWTAERPDKVTVQNGCDPCKALGGSWRLPRLAEWRTMLNAEGITDVASGFRSNLKFPAAGVRNGINGKIENPGPFGHYWSNTAGAPVTFPPPFTNTIGRAYEIYLTDEIELSLAQLNSGSNLRCILAGP